jgi:hypothetical protein
MFYHSTITEYVANKGDELIALREYMQGEKWAVTSAYADGTRNPDMRRYDWKEIDCIPEGAEVAGEYYGHCPIYGKTFYTLFIRRK